MKQKVIMFVGISGVGKTTFLLELQSSLSFQHLTAGTLIAAGAESSDVDRDKLRLANIGGNQRLLISGFNLKRDHRSELVVLDGHAIIDTGNGLEEIGTDVFAELKIDAIVHLSAAPERISGNRSKDTNRVRPLLSIEAIVEHQARSIAVCQMVARELGIPFVDLVATDRAKMLSLAEKLKHEY